MKWYNFPAARPRLPQRLTAPYPADLRPVGGNRHMGKVLELAAPVLARRLVEVTPSGLP